MITLLLLIANARYVFLLVCSKHLTRNIILGTRSYKFPVTAVKRKFAMYNDVGPAVNLELFSQNMAKINLELHCRDMLGRSENLQRYHFFFQSNSWFLVCDGDRTPVSFPLK